MNVLTIQPRRIVLLISFLQVILLFSYLSMNILNVGKAGIALPLLAGFVGIAGILLIYQLVRFTLAVRLHLFVFLLLISWVALRVIFDLGDLEQLKQLTIATTGGMLLFFLIGSFARQALDKLNEPSISRLFPNLLLYLFLIVSLTIFISFKGRLLDRVDIFYIAGVEGGYQRPGNFLIMMFTMVSFSYLALASHPLNKGVIQYFIWLFLYSIGLVLVLISSQMIGSNAATVNILAIYLMTGVISLLALNSKLRIKFYQSHLALPLSKAVFKKLLVYSVIALLVVFVLATLAIQLTGFDLSKTRIFGFGSDSNSSITSRFDILFKTGAAQLGYAPFLGNVNVAEITTGFAGKTLHNFIPNVLAELGLIGLILAFMLFFLVFYELVKNTKRSAPTPEGFRTALLNFWLIFVFIWLFIYANLSVGKSWSVIWFFIGFTVNVFIFNDKLNRKARCAVF